MWNGASCPADVLEAIPWYPDGLTSAQRGGVEAHAAVCSDCRRELALVQGEPMERPLAAPEAERVWTRVLERIAHEDDAEVAPWPAARAPQRRSRGWLRAAARPLPLAASLALALGVGALGALVGSTLAGRDEPVYLPATAPPAVSAAGPALDVVFRKSASAAEIEKSLHAIEGSLAAGPSALGVYRVALRPGADAAGAAAALRAEAGGVAILAEPVHP
jgi:hypothetical protein